MLVLNSKQFWALSADIGAVNINIDINININININKM